MTFVHHILSMITSAEMLTEPKNRPIEVQLNLQLLNNVSSSEIDTLD